MKKNMFVVISVVSLASLSLFGSVLAWFLTQSYSAGTEFKLGTLEIGEPAVISQSVADGYESDTWYSGELNTVNYSIKNMGTMELYLRVKPRAVFVDSAIVEGAEPIEVEVSPSASMDNLFQGGEGWYYYCSDELIVVESEQTVPISFDYFIPEGAVGNVIIDLSADSIQADSESKSYYWGQIP